MLTLKTHTGRTLRAIGDGYLSLGSAVNGLNDTIAMRVVEELEQLQQSYAAFSKAVKESDKARSALESRLASVRPQTTFLQWS